MQKISFTIFTLLFLVWGSLVAQTSPMVVDGEVLTGSPLYYNHTPNIARTSDGALVSVWKSGAGQIVFSEYDAVFGTWSPPIALSNAGDRAEKAGITTDENGNIYVVWQQRETSGQDYAIYFTKKMNGFWLTPTNLTGNDVENEEASIALNDQGKIFVAWNTDSEPDSSEFVLCITSNDGGTSWSDPVILSSEDGIIGGTSTTSGRPYLARATNGKMVCAWHEEPDGHPDRESFINQYDGTNWMGEVSYIYAADSANTMYPAVAMDSEDNIYMALVSYTPVERLLFISKPWDAADWSGSTSKVLLEDTQVTKPVIGIDGNNNLYLAFRRDNAADTTYGIEEIAFITSENLGETWSDATRLSRENYDAGYITMINTVRETGIDFLWRESVSQFIDDGDTTAIMYGHTDLITDVKDLGNNNVESYELGQNYPNPFNPSTVINFSIPESGLVTLKVFNILGQEVAELVNNVKSAGSYEVSFDASNLTSGMYVYKIQAGDFSATKKMMLVK